ncbi:MAG: MBL fold metallo-hydrolase, partial [Lachnospiraceae bacterium]|nr:MBL fold metallo-hydrolase [Lachnospiraceae bacterium]
MKLTFIGADHEVTGSCHFVECAGKNFLVDCGMQQGPETYENQDIPVDAAKIDYVFVTHAHIDHSGLLPLLYAHGFRGVIFATQATCELCNIMLKDSAHIQESEAEWRNRKAKRAGKPDVVPLYTMDDAIGVLDHFVSVAYYDRVEVCDGISVRFVDAGHLLGSASIEVWLSEDGEERKLVFSGDIGNPNKPLVKDPDFLDSEADMMRPTARRLYAYRETCQEAFRSQPFRELEITSFDGLKLRGYLVERDPKEVVICVHGYKSDPESDFCDRSEIYAARGTTVLFVHDRAHGKSGGRYLGFSELDRFDIAKWVDKINEMYDDPRIYLHGVSMGGATVIHCANMKLKNVCGIIDDCGFNSILGISKAL